MSSELFGWLDLLARRQPKLERILHMSPATKYYEVREWEKKISGPRGDPGEGYPDNNILPLCEQINRLHGICTMQSCAGHPRDESKQRRWHSQANLWLWFNKGVFLRFVQHAPILAKCECIEGIALLYGRYSDNRVVASIDFHGDEAGPAVLESSGREIFAFLDWL